MTEEKRISPGNVHVLSEEVLKTFEEKYEVSWHTGFLLFKLRYQNYTRAYPIGKKFNVMNNDKVKMTISPTAVEIWHKQREHSLFSVQNAVNALSLKNERATPEAVEEILKK